MPTEEPEIGRHWHTVVASGSILVAAPFLLFPTLLVEGTFLALILVAGVWLWPLIFSRRPTLPVTPFNIALLLLSLTLIVGILVTADPQLTLPKATGLILGLAVWGHVTTSMRNRRWLHLYLTLFALLGLGFVLLGALTANWLPKVPLLADVVNLLPALLVKLPESASGGVHPNQLAGTSLIFLPLPFSFLIGWRRQLNNRLLVVASILLAMLITSLLALTQSRSGWIGGIGGLMALLLLWGSILPPSPRRNTVRLAAVIMLLLGIILVFVIGPARLGELWSDPSQETAVGNLSSLSFRQEVWRWSIMAVGDFPFTGTGLGSFRQVVRRLYPLAVSPTYDIAHAHNIFLQVALDVGLPGLIAYLALLMIAFSIGWQTARQDQRLRPLALGLLAGLAALHVFGMTDALSLGSKPGLVFWMALGILSGMHHIVTRQPAG